MSTGLGVEPFGVGYLGVPGPELVGQVKTPLSSSRSIDADGRYEMETTGEFVPMPDVKQRVLLLVSFGAGKNPPFMDDRSRESVARNIRAALVPLSGGKEPLIEVQAVEVTRAVPCLLKRVVIFRELTNDIVHTVEA